MNLRFIETFVWLAQFRNFRMTADKLHMTQAAVSSRIAALEQEFGVQLFERSTRDVALTRDGSKALVYAQRLVRTMHEMRQGMADRTLYTGVVRIGAIESIIHSWFPQLVAAVHHAYPQLEVELSGDTSLHLVDQFSKSNLDLVLQTDPILAPQVENVPLCSFPMRWVGATRLGLHDTVLTLHDLAAFPIISFSRNSGPHKTIERLYRDNPARKLHVNCMTSLSAMIQLLLDGFGVAALPPAIIQRELQEGSLQLLHVDAALPALVLIASYRSDEEPLFAHLASIAQEAAAGFLRTIPAANRATDG